MRQHVRLIVNGSEQRVEGADVFLPLADYLRVVRRATGTKVVCAEGDCGACTVLIGRPEGDRIEYRAINSCIYFIYQLDGAHVVTVEGLGAELNPVQTAMVDHYGAQCGYCTPGFVMAMTGLAEQKVIGTEPVPAPSPGRPGGTDEPGNRGTREAAVREGLTGNLCRCTGYEPIIRAALAVPRSSRSTLAELYPPATIVERLRKEEDDVEVDADGRLFCGAVTLDRALAFKAANRDAVVVQGGTDVGVFWNKRGIRPRAILSLARVEGLDGIEVSDATLRVGARVSLTDLQTRAAEAAPELHAILGYFGSPQIRNAATLAGNIANGSPVADLLPFLFVTEAEIEVASVRGTRTVPVGLLYRGYKQLAIEGDELITRVVIPLPAADEKVRLYKVSKRRDLDISTFTAAVRMSIVDGRMARVRIAYGGVGPVVLRLPKTEALLEGATPARELFREAGRLARTEITPISDVRGSAEYRSLLAERILMKFFVNELEDGKSEVRVSA